MANHPTLTKNINAIIVYPRQNTKLNINPLHLVEFILNINLSLETLSDIHKIGNPISPIIKGDILIHSDIINVDALPKNNDEKLRTSQRVPNANAKIPILRYPFRVFPFVFKIFKSVRRANKPSTIIASDTILNPTKLPDTEGNNIFAAIFAPSKAAKTPIVL